MKAKALGAALLIGCAALAQAQEAPKPPPFTFALKGFVSMSGCFQDGAFGLSECQQSLFAGQPAGTNLQPTTDENSLSFDVRQSRFNFSVKGPPVFMGATPSMVLEIDFMQGFGAGAFGNVSLLNRMRLAYSELNWGANRLAFGQLNDLTFAMAPVSLSHIAFPLGYATGNIGWRRPGVFGFHTLQANPDLKLELAWEVGRSQWNEAASGIGVNFSNQPSGTSLGEASALPALQARLTASFKTLFTAWVAGHWNRVDLSGVGDGNATGGRSINVEAVAAGAKATEGPLTLAATGYTGKNTGPLLGNLVQFGLGPNNNGVNAWGFWVQGGFNFTKELSAWALYGLQKPNEDDAKAARFARLKNQTVNAFLQYRDGGYAVSAEWLNFKTKNAFYNAAGFTNSDTARVNQYILTANYFF